DYYCATWDNSLSSGLF
nr:immunoglobulin light chain junction region [Macaca mulatta]MOX33222.1 immunoglobulin light chain junction region [Macaca mulatta]MOX33239.1 immunoglobulin light chain junction region [Macaca mulatta]MOX33240.1 immunoglobulin light chain junction region [Macaca mulatta]MOX33283.1 immunoglobulin light chain junction region [Macaca mulatta]